MKYISTRNSEYKVSAAEAIVSGLAPDGGLFLPEIIPSITQQDILSLAKMDYPHRAADILGRFLDGFAKDELLEMTTAAYAPDRFRASGTAPVVKVGDSEFILELFHGPTCAFKDFALQMLPRLMTASVRKTGVDKTVVILVATSGDTGKAALEGFADIDGTKICVFYPHGGTSNIQRRQMTTQSGGNVMVAAVKGNFDDAQNGVKAIFTDKEYAEKLSEKGFLLSSANSINWGRLAPQIAYYFSAYCDLLNSGDIKAGEKINITVPTGNFGNILAAYYAKKCGLPVSRLICASNKNRVLTDFIQTGRYDKNRPFYITSSPSMDILISSNLERLLYLLGGGDAKKIAALMQQLKSEGCYFVDGSMHDALKAELECGSADDEQTAETIKTLYDRTGYLCDTHTAVAVKVYEDYAAATGDTTKTVIASTASPFKFCSSVLPALGYSADGDDFDMLAELESVTGKSAPENLSGLKDRAERFNDVIEPSEMKNVVLSML